MILEKINRFYLNHFTQHIILDEIASAGVCCKIRRSSLFKKYLRETPMTYIAKLRLQKSLVPLLGSDRDIAKIAYEYGFCWASYYCETFQKYYGMSRSIGRRRRNRNGST